MKTQTIRGFRSTLISVGVFYSFLACIALVRGVSAMSEFGVSPQLIESDVVEDFFVFYYKFMFYIGVLTALLGHVTRERRSQIVVAIALCLANVYFTLHDISTSEYAWGNGLYKGPRVLIFVVLGVGFSTIFGWLATRGMLEIGGSKSKKP